MAFAGIVVGQLCECSVPILSAFAHRGLTLAFGYISDKIGRKVCLATPCSYTLAEQSAVRYAIVYRHSLRLCCSTGRSERSGASGDHQRDHVSTANQDRDEKDTDGPNIEPTDS